MSRRQSVSFLIKRFKEVGLRPDTRHGQNFLVDLNLVELLADTARIERQDVVLEVGTGTGSLTALLARRAGAVVTIELSAALQQLASEELEEFDNIIMLQQDALKNKNRLNPQLVEAVVSQLAAAPGRRAKLVANLPYNIATPVISNLLATEFLPVSMTVTIQKELADRIAARPGTKDYSGLSIWVQSQCDVQVVRVLPPTVFWPRPKVHSAIIQITVRPEKRASIPDLPFFHQCVRSLFIHRRKFLRSGILGAFKQQLDKPAVDHIMSALNLGPTTRAEQLDVDEIRVLCEAIRRTVATANDPETD
ncbi:MAG: ribosomal RNA small subunit methyltransferase A [Planctomycetes bacterium]|nr:ribosomal RNA small subunit methyltransferase A [Planctomycetota bacterium]